MEAQDIISVFLCLYSKASKGNIPVAVAYLCLFNSLGKYWHKEERTQLSCAVWISFCDILAKNVSSSYSLWNKLSQKKVIVRRSHWWGYNFWLLLLKTVGRRSLSMGFNKTWWLTLLSELTRAKRDLEEAGCVCGPVCLLPGMATHLNAADSIVGLDTWKKMISFGNTGWHIEFRWAQPVSEFPGGTLQGLGIWRGSSISYSNLSFIA